MSIRSWRVSAASLLLVLTGCGAVPLQSGRSRVAEFVQARSGASLPADSTDVDQSVQQLLREPLQPNTAVQIALLRNATLQLQLAKLGLGAADVYDASRLSNPSLSFAVLFPVGGATGEKQNAGATFSFSDLLLRHARSGIAASEYQRTQALVAAAIFDLALDVQHAWFECVGAEQRAAVRRSIEESAQSSAELADRYHQAGNIDELALLLRSAAASEARIDARAAAADLAEAHARLQTMMGLGAGEAQWSVPAQLPAPDEVPTDIPKLQALALKQRLDLAGARAAVAAAEQQLSVTQHYRYLGPANLGVAGEREADGSKRVGPSLSLTLPVFNQGQGAVARAEAQLASAQATRQILETQIGNEVQRHAERMAAARERATAYREALIPQREAVVARYQERVNFMLTDAFSLLLAKQQEYAAYGGYVDAVQAYWAARVELVRSVGTALPEREPAAAGNSQVQP